MSKNKTIWLILGFSNLLFGWGKQQAAPEYCSGTVCYSDSQKQLVDLKIGINNKHVVAYLKPEKAGQELVEYEFNLNDTKEITVPKVSPWMVKSKKYIHIDIVSRKSSKPVECVIPSDKRLIGKYKSTGATVKYPFDTVDKVEFDNCTHDADHVATKDAEKTLAEVKEFVNNLDGKDHATIKKEAHAMLIKAEQKS